MKFILKFAILIVLSFGYTTQGTKYQHFGDCNFINIGTIETNFFTFICTQNIRLNKLMTKFEDTLTCENDQSFYRYWFGTVDFQNCEIPQIPTDLFKIYYNINTFNMSSLGVQSFQVDTFAGAKNLMNLNASNNQIEEIPSFLFHNMVELIEIDLSFNKIRKIDDFAFAGAYNLQKLNFSHNQITSFDKGILESQQNLIHLDISKNKINILRADTFEVLRNLVILNLSGNFIKKFEPKIFVNLVNLQYLNISQNKLSKVEPNTFLNQTELQNLDLSHNELRKLNVNIFASAPNQLKLLVIGQNQLREMNGFTSSLIPNTKIAGIDTNNFNCSYLKRTLFPSITWSHLDLISNRINCSSSDDVTKPSIETTTAVVTEKTTQPYTEDATTEAEIKINKENPENVTKPVDKLHPWKEESVVKANNKPVSINSESDHIQLMKHFVMTTWINVVFCIICLFIAIVAFTCLILRKRKPRRNVVTNVFYRQNEINLLEALKVFRPQLI